MPIDRKRAGVWLRRAAALFGLALLPSCESDVERRVALAELSSQCRINSDCSELLMCAFERCHQQCSSSRDCERGARCVQTSQGRNVCQLADEATCSDTKPCNAGQVCGPDAECHDGCRSDDDCVSEQVCAAAVCADTAELGDDGVLPPAPEPPSAPVPCSFDSDCPLPSICVEGACRAECASSADCGSGQRCQDSRCVPEPTPGACLRSSDCEAGNGCVEGRCQPLTPVEEPECDYDSDCERPGQHCRAGSCRCECAKDADCGSGHACADSCQCVPSRVIVGSVWVSNDAEARALDDVVEITGQLTVDSYRYGVLRFPTLQKAKRVVASGNYTTVVFDKLETVTELFVCNQDCYMNALRKVGELQMSTQATRDISFPALEHGGALSLKNSPNVGAIRLPSLMDAQGLVIESNKQLQLVQAPKLKTITGSLSVSNNERLRELTLPLAEPQVNLTLASDGALERASLPGVRELSGKLYVFETGVLRSLDLGALRIVGEIEMRGLSAISELKLTSLWKVTGRASFTHVYSPLALSLPALQSAGSFDFTGASTAVSFSAPELTETGSFELAGLHALTELDVGKLATVNGNFNLFSIGVSNLSTLSKLTRAYAVSISGNTSLPDCLIEAFHDQLDPLFLQSFGANMNCACPEAVCP